MSMCFVKEYVKENLLIQQIVVSMAANIVSQNTQQPTTPSHFTH